MRTRPAMEDDILRPCSIEGPLFTEPTPFESSNSTPSAEEKWIAELIFQRKGRHWPFPIAELTTVTGIPEREIKGIVEQLRNLHRMPIGAKRDKGGGYFWIVDSEDRRVAVSTYRKQLLSMWRTLCILDVKDSLLDLRAQLRLEEEE